VVEGMVVAEVVEVAEEAGVVEMPRRYLPKPSVQIAVGPGTSLMIVRNLVAFVASLGTRPTTVGTILALSILSLLRNVLQVAKRPRLRPITWS
jgi:hypothetical protein